MAEVVEETITLQADPSAPAVAMAFKIVDDAFGQLTFMRIYQGTLERGGVYYNQRSGRKERFSRIYRMHAEKREEVELAEAGPMPPLPVLPRHVPTFSPWPVWP